MLGYCGILLAETTAGPPKIEHNGLIGMEGPTGAVSYLARYSGRTHSLYAYQLRELVLLVRDLRAGPRGWGPASSRRAVHPRSR